MSSKSKDRRQSRSARLRKYGNVYKKVVTHKKLPELEQKERSIDKINDSEKRRKKVLNEYQKFFKIESKKEKYKEMSSKQRMSQIATLWERKKRYDKKHKKKT